MKKRVKKIDNELEGEEGEGPWLLSYADMVTLLMCFFILFFNIEKPEESINDIENLAKKLANIIAIEKPLTLDEMNSSRNAKTKTHASVSQDSRQTEKALKDRLKSLSKTLKIAFTAKTPEPGVTEITFLNSNFFRSGSSDMTDSGSQMVAAIAPKLQSILENDTEIEVEGHSDGDPIRGGRFENNWELSAGRAASVVQLLSRSGIPLRHLKVVGMANTAPVANETNRKGQQIASAKMLNRRVVVRIREKSRRTMK